MNAEILAAQLRDGCSGPGRRWIAYSGGLDSTVLLHLAVAARLGEIQAVHVHHGLNPRADAWAAHCSAVCARLGVPCRIARVDARAAPGESPEAAARAARYTALAECLEPGETMLSAQHGDDQAETLLLQLLRGAGPAGLAAMPAVAPLGRGRLLRPLLGVSRAELLDYAQRHDLSWIEDDSNEDLRFDRNFLRHQVMPVLQRRWPGLRRTLSRAAAHQAQAAALLQELAEQDGQGCAAELPLLLAGLFPRALALSLAALQKLPAARRDNVLRAWLARQGFLAPPAAQLRRMAEDMPQAGADRQPLIAWPGAEVRRYRDWLLALPPLPPPPGARVLTWKPPAVLALPLGCLRANENFQLSLPITVRFRQGGETCRARGLTQSLKNLMQAAGLPAWLRDYAPLVYAGDELAAVPGVVEADGFQNSGLVWRA